jgi:hypothetical protein
MTPSSEVHHPGCEPGGAEHMPTGDPFPSLLGDCMTERSIRTATLLLKRAEHRCKLKHNCRKVLHDSPSLGRTKVGIRNADRTFMNIAHQSTLLCTGAEPIRYVCMSCSQPILQYEEFESRSWFLPLEAADRNPSFHHPVHHPGERIEGGE